MPLLSAVGVGPVCPGLVRRRVVRRVATAQEPAEDEEQGKRDAGQSQEPLPRGRESAGRRGHGLNVWHVIPFRVPSLVPRE